MRSSPATDQLSRLLLVGAGDIGRRAVGALRRNFTVIATTRDPVQAQALAALGVQPLTLDLDRADTLANLPAIEAILFTAPPQAVGRHDERTRNLIVALSGRNLRPRRVVYVSTSGVYGDCQGEWVDESRPVNPGTDRAHRRCDAEAQWMKWTGDINSRLTVLRAPGIYGNDRFPLSRLRAGTPVLRREDDVYTNHIHADDLAAICVRALRPESPAGVYNAVDDSDIRMGDWMDRVADAFGLARPPRISRDEAARRIPAGLLSFMSESRRLVNTRLKRGLGYVLRYPTVIDGLHAARPARAA